MNSNVILTNCRWTDKGYEILLSNKYLNKKTHRFEFYNKPLLLSCTRDAYLDDDSKFNRTSIQMIIRLPLKKNPSADFNIIKMMVNKWKKDNSFPYIFVNYFQPGRLKLCPINMAKVKTLKIEYDPLNMVWPDEKLLVGNPLVDILGENIVKNIGKWTLGMEKISSLFDYEVQNQGCKDTLDVIYSLYGTDAGLIDQKRAAEFITAIGAVASSESVENNSEEKYSDDFISTPIVDDPIEEFNASNDDVIDGIDDSDNHRHLDLDKILREE